MGQGGVMKSIHEIIKQIQKDLYCPVCGKNYEIGEIRLRGLFDHTLIVQTVCANNHMTVFMTTYEQKNNINPVSSDDILDLHNVLSRFNGDFDRVWNK